MINFDQRFDIVKINTFWLSDDGTDQTDMCAVQIPNLRRFSVIKKGNSFKSIKGNQVTQFFPWRGEVFEVQCEKLRADIYSRVTDAFNDFISTGARMNLEIVSSEKTFKFIVEPSFPNPNVEQKNFFGDLEGVVFRFAVHTLVSVEDN